MSDIAYVIIDPESAAQHRLVGLLMIGSTVLVCGWLSARFGWRSWWIVIAAAIAVPNIIAPSFGGRLPGKTWPLSDFLMDVVGPLGVLGLASGLLGVTLGAIIRAWQRRSAKAANGRHTLHSPPPPP